MDVDGANNSALQLPTALQLHILSFLPPNDRALSGRLVSPDLKDALSEPQHCTASLFQPLPPHAVPWAVEAGQQHMRQLPFLHKLQLLCTAATSGSEVNLEVALALLQLSVFSELLQHWEGRRGPDPGVAAVKAGHPQLLGWLLHRCPGLLRPSSVLRAAARHCDLAGLQAVWGALGGGVGSSDGGSSSPTNQPGWHQAVLDTAAKSVTPDGPAKLEWLLAISDGSCRLQESTAMWAVCCGGLGLLRWLHGHGCPMDDQVVLNCALLHADLAVAECLVDEAGCKLPAGGSAASHWGRLLAAAARSPDGVAKLAWLQKRGAPPPAAELVCEAVCAGQAEVARSLLQVPGAISALRQGGLGMRLVAVKSHSIPTLELMCEAGVQFTHDGYTSAAGSLAMVRWLACNTEAPTGHDLYQLTYCWGRDTPAHSRELLEAVQLLVGEAVRRGARVGYRAALATAAERGDVALVRYLLQQQRLTGWPQYQPGWDFLVLAAKAGCEALLEWLVEENPGCLGLAGARQTPYVAAAKNGDRGTLAALRRLGVPWGAEDVVVRALRAGSPVPALQWLVEQGAPLGSARDVRAKVASELAKTRLNEEEAAWLRGLAPRAGA